MVAILPGVILMEAILLCFFDCRIGRADRLFASMGRPGSFDWQIEFQQGEDLNLVA